MNSMFKKIVVSLTALCMTLASTAALPAAAADADISKAVTEAVLDNQLLLKLDISENSGVMPGDRISLGVAGPNVSPDSVTGDSFVYADGFVVKIGDKEYIFKYGFKNNAEGKYIARLSRINSDNEYSYCDYNVKIVSENSLNEMLKEFDAVTSEKFGELLTKYTKDLEYFSVEDISELSALSKTIGDSFVMTREAIKKGLINDELTSINDISALKSVLRASVLIDMLRSGTKEQLKTAIGNYSADAPNLIESTADTDKFLEKYTIKEHASFSELASEVRLCTALTAMYGASKQTIKNLLEKYSDVLRVDTVKIKNSGLTLMQIANELDNTVPDSYSDGLADEIDVIIKNLTAQNTNSKPSKGTGGTGGGGRVTNSPSTPGNVPKDDINKPEQSPEIPFADIGNTEWARDEIIMLYNKGIINGVGGGNFEPERNLKREEFVKMIVSAFSVTVGDKDMPEFNDCSVEAWYYPYIVNAYTAGVIMGVNASEFGIGADITRQDAAVICYRILAAGNVAPKGDPEVFKDDDKIAGYAKNPIMFLSSLEILKGNTDGNFEPEKVLTRAEAAVILSRMISLSGGLV